MIRSLCLAALTCHCAHHVRKIQLAGPVYRIRQYAGVAMLGRFAATVSLVFSSVLVSRLSAQDPDGYPRAMQGPMLGTVTETSFAVWARTSWNFPVQVAYSESPTFEDEKRTVAVVPKKDRDYCVSIVVNGLKPSTIYYYRLIIDGGEDKYQGGKPPHSARTSPAVGAPVKFRIAHGSCARWQSEPRQRIWPVIRDYQPDLFFWLGDNVYADTLDPDVLAEELARQREVPDLRPLLATVPQLAIWDDHDYGLNNHDRTNPQKESFLGVWKRYWPNPGFGTESTKGVFFRYSYGDVDFFFLDGRYHRDPNKLADGPQKTMLGKAQLAWLKRGLSGSSATFKVLVSGSIWTADKGPGGDAWSSYRTERDSLFDWIMEEQILGVVLVSGDTHTGELNAACWSKNGGYDLYDFVSSPLAQEPDNDWLFREVDQRIRLPYNQGENFGIIDFDTTVEDPKLTFRLVGLSGKAVWEPLELRASELKVGRSTWSEKQSSDAAKWMKRIGR
jgi:alkaline phosphatase D